MNALITTLTMAIAASSIVFSSDSCADADLAEMIRAVQSNQKSNKLSSSLTTAKEAFETQESQFRTNPMVSQHNGLVAVEILISGDSNAAVRSLHAVGLRDLVVTTTTISGYIPIAELNSLSGSDFVKAVRYNKVFTKSGSVESQGVGATNSSGISSMFNVTGDGIRVGVISDSFNCLGGEQADIASGDIPDDVLVLIELEDCSMATDEGRALVQIVHDFASDAEFVFGTGTGAGLASVAQLITSMVDTHDVDIIVDDVGSYLEMFFQDDTVSMAIEYASSQGVSYVTAAGNGGRNSYEGLFAGTFDPVLGLIAHDFNITDEVSIFQNITIPFGEPLDIVLQWDEPAYSISGGAGARSDLDIFLINMDGSVIHASAAQNNLGADPLEILSFINDDESQNSQFQLLIIHAQGRMPGLVKYYIPTRFSGSIDNYHTASGTIVGRTNSAGSISVGATPYLLTQKFGHPSDEVETFSATGGVPILFDNNGERINNEFRVRYKPDLTAPDGVSTTFFGDYDADDDGLPNFLGTSASAPHVAGIIALMREAAPDLDPSQIQYLLQQTASDIVLSDGADLPRGFDFTSGYGFVNGYDAVREAIAWSANWPAPVQRNQSYSLFDGIRPTLDNDAQANRSIITVGGAMGWEAVLVLLLIFPMVVTREKA